VATTSTRLTTFEEFEKIPNPPGHRYELRHGELCKVAFPKISHMEAQWQLRQLLQAAAGDGGKVHTEFPYRPLPEYECWCADVAYVPEARLETIEDWLLGSPDLVIEVLSPSNTADEMLEKRKLCLENGSKEFWIVDMGRHQVEVSTPDGHSITYKSGQEIPLFFVENPGGGRLAVDAIFS
jgi:Uma2 family endonuclease